MKAAPPVCLSVAGLDPSGGAGVIADIRTFSAFGCYATAAISAVTFQNTVGVFGSVSESVETVRGQIAPIFEDFDVAAVKTGMLPTAAIIEHVAELLLSARISNLVVDPVVRSTSGYDLIDNAALSSLVSWLFPIAEIVTPNLVEAERICGFEIKTDDDLRRAGARLLELGARNVLIKGGHRRETFGTAARAIDHLFTAGGEEKFDSEFISTTATHGTGCVLSSAITANLALGINLSKAVGIAKEFVRQGIQNAPKLGHGHSPLSIAAIWRGE